MRSKFNPCFSAKKKFKFGGDAFCPSRIILNNCWATLAQPAYKRSKGLARSSDPQRNNRTTKRSNIQKLSRVGATALIISSFANIRHERHGRQEIAGCSSNAIDCLSWAPRLDVQLRAFMFVCFSASILRGRIQAFPTNFGNDFTRFFHKNKSNYKKHDQKQCFWTVKPP